MAATTDIRAVAEACSLLIESEGIHNVVRCDQVLSRIGGRPQWHARTLLTYENGW
jgi:hypothetical protein